MATSSETYQKKSKVVDASKEPPVYEYAVDKTDEKGIRYPDQDIPESEKNPQWYIDNIHYISTFYNVSFQSVLVPTQNNDSSPGVPSGTLNPQDLPINRMLKNMQYYQGKQENVEFADWTPENVDGNNYQPHWIKGQDIAELLNHMKGTMLERIANLQITGKALSENVASEKEDYRTKLLMKFKFKDVFAEMKQMGVEFNVGPQKELESEEAIDEFMEKKFKAQGVDVAIAMAKDAWYKNFMLQKFLDSFVKCLMTGTAQMHHYVQNGRLYIKNIPSWQMIYDTRHDDDYNRDAQFIGVVETMTPTELFSRFPKLNKEQREEIKKMSRQKDLGGRYNAAFSNFLWWNYNVKRDECVITVVTAYWMGLHDMGLKKKKDKFDIDRIMKVVKDENGDLEKGDYGLDDVYRATLIGNRYLVEYGLDDNIVEDPLDKTKPMFPIMRYLPNMTGGEPRAMVSRFTDLQDEIDALKYKVRELIGRSKGRCYIVRPSGAGNNTTLQEIYKDFGSMGMTVIPETGEDPSSRDSRLLEMADFSLDPNIMRIEEIVRINRDLLKEYASVSNVSLGMQTTYMGSGERNAAIGQSSYGLAALYHGFMDFIQMNLQYACNVTKNLYTMDDNDTEASFVVGEKGIAYLKVMKDMKFEDFLIMLQLNDVIDDAKRKDIQQLALAWAQNGIIGPDAYIKVLKEETMSGAQRVLEFEVQKAKKEKMQEQQVQMQHEQAMGAQQADALHKAEVLRQSGQDHREAMAGEAKQNVALINKSGQDNKAK